MDSIGKINWGSPLRKWAATAPSPLSSQPKVAVLILEDPLGRAGNKQSHFDSRRYLGLNIVLDVLRRAYDVQIDYTSVGTINEYDIVMVSLTATPDVFNFVYTMEKYDIEVTRPKIIVGGAGVLNIRPYLRYGDYFVFGRGEVPIIDIFEHLINGAPKKNGSVFIKGESDFNQVGGFTLAQVDDPYPFEVNGLGESMLGCPKKCFYCGYTYHRKPQKSVYVYRDDEFVSASEMTIREVIPEIKNGSRVITSIDGSSARLRSAMLKAMTDDEYRDVIRAIPKVEADSVFLKIFNICGYPTETEEERFEPFEVLSPVANDLANSTTIVYQMNPFIPMALTPAQYLPADVGTDYRDWYTRYVPKVHNGKWVVETGRLRVGYGPAINTNLGLLKRVLIHRGMERDTVLLKNIVFNKKLRRMKASDAARALLSLPDMERFYRQYEIGEPMPFDYLRSYSSKKAIDNLARRLHRDLGIGGG